jgi:hypothetical protein
MLDKNINYEEILNVLKDCELQDRFTSYDTTEKILNFLPSYFEFEENEGATKFVLMPFHASYVIKIPFSGDYRDGYGEDGYCEFEYGNDDDNWNCWDYCHAEILLLQSAKEYQVEEIFCQEEMIGQIQNFPIYIQEVAEVYDESERSSSVTQEEIDFAEEQCEINNYYFKDSIMGWVADVINYYGEEKFEDLVEFIKDYDIEDLHMGNVGYIGSRPVIIDFASFNEY